MKAVGGFLVALVLVGSARAEREPRPPAIFALVVGVNRSVDGGVPPLAYADDDAALYLELFRALGAQAILLSAFDENTRRLHPQAVAEAREPTRRDLMDASRTLAQAVAQARRRDVETVLYVVYAGHGSAEEGEGYVSLADGRLYGRDIGRMVIQRIGADRTHLIVDACQAYYLVHGRGPGGQRRPVSGFSVMAVRPEFRGVGLVLSTSSGKESHEWEGFQAGVFSHEVRSGLYGGADVDADGLVTYRELGAFVRRANEAIPNERYRPDVFVRPPSGSAELLNLRRGFERSIHLDGTLHGRWLLEDDEGVRLVDLHSAPGSAVRLVRPARPGTLYLRRLEDDREYSLASAAGPVEVADLVPSSARSRTRGAAHEAFRRTFELAFDGRAVATFRYSSLATLRLGTEGDRLAWDRRRVGFTLAAAGGTAIVAGLALGGTALVVGATVDDRDPQRDAARANDRVRWLDRGALVLGGVGGAAALAGLAVWLWPEAPVRPVVGVGMSETAAGLEVEF